MHCDLTDVMSLLTNYSYLALQVAVSFIKILYFLFVDCVSPGVEIERKKNNVHSLHFYICGTLLIHMCFCPP